MRHHHIFCDDGQYSMKSQLLYCSMCSNASCFTINSRKSPDNQVLGLSLAACSHITTQWKECRRNQSEDGWLGSWFILIISIPTVSSSDEWEETNPKFILTCGLTTASWQGKPYTFTCRPDRKCLDIFKVDCRKPSRFNLAGTFLRLPFYLVLSHGLSLVCSNQNL